jgi:hypothetical protein
MIINVAMIFIIENSESIIMIDNLIDLKDRVDYLIDRVDY